MQSCRHFFISLIAVVLLSGCASLGLAPSTMPAPATASDGSMPSVEVAADEILEQSYSPAYTNAISGGKKQRYKNCFDIDIKAAAERAGTLTCLRSMMAGESKDYFNQQTHFLIQCAHRSFSSGTIESNVQAEFSEAFADFTISIPRADAGLPDTVRVNGMAINRDRNALVQSDLTKVVLLRDNQPWQGGNGEAQNFDVAIGFAQVFYVRPDSPGRIWGFGETYLEIKAQYANSCQLKVTVGSVGSSTEPSNQG